MSDRCMIGLVNSDNTITSVYCHWNGDPKDAGAILLNNYKSVCEVRRLLQRGYLRALGNSPEESAQMENPGEAADTDENQQTFKSRADSFGVSFLYLFSNDGWMFATPIGSGWRKLSEVLEKWQ